MSTKSVMITFRATEAEAEVLDKLAVKLWGESERRRGDAIRQMIRKFAKAQEMTMVTGGVQISTGSLRDQINRSLVVSKPAVFRTSEEEEVMANRERAIKKYIDANHIERKSLSEKLPSEIVQEAKRRLIIIEGSHI